jgi:hypothetical protein
MEEPIAPETPGHGQRRFPSDWVSGGNLERDRLPGAFQLCSLNRAEMAGGVPASRLERSLRADEFRQRLPMPRMRAASASADVGGI